MKRTAILKDYHHILRIMNSCGDIEQLRNTQNCIANFAARHQNIVFMEALKTDLEGTYAERARALEPEIVNV